jgi:GNAT superfamily N-acetyltransferase
VNHVDLDRARREAKQLLAAARRGEPEALARLRADRAPLLADAQHAVACAHGYARWADLVRAQHDAGAALRKAALAGDDDALYALLEAGAPPNARDPRTGRTALLCAAAADQLDAVSALVGWVPVDRYSRDRRQRSALDFMGPVLAVAAVRALGGFGAPRPPLGARYAAQADAAELALLTHLARAPGVERHDLGDGVVVRTGLPDNSRNGVVCSRLPLDADVVAIVAGFAGLPARWYVSDANEPFDLPDRLEAVGCRAERTAVHMAAELDDLGGAMSTDVREAHDAIDLVHLAGLTTFAAGSTLLGLHLRVERAQRRRGHARTLIRHAAAVGLADGCTHAVLAPTPATITLYERLGFVLERSLPDRWYYLP